MEKARRSEVKGAVELIARAFCEYPLYAYFFGGTPETRYRKALAFVNYECMRPPDSLYVGDGAAALFVKEGDSLAKPPASVVAELLAAAGPLATFKAVRYILKAERFAHSLELPVAKLVFLAVDESRRGEGLGVKALGYFLAEENFVLETHDGSKAAYYLRHGGRLVAEYDLTKSLKHSIIIFEKSLLSAEEK